MNIKLFQKKYTLKRGFSLIELLVSLALFGFVIVAVVGAVLSVMDGNRKAQSLVSAMDGLNFAMDSMTRELRVGDSYNCDGIGDCPLGRAEMSFTSSDNTLISYRQSGDQIQRCGTSDVGGVGGEDCGAVGVDYVPMTGSNIVIDELTFYVQGSAPFPDDEQPRVTIVVAGTAGGGDTASSFRIQTTVTQRFPDF